MRVSVSLLVLCLLPGAALGQGADAVELFEKKVRPLLAARCHACHGPKLQMAGLDLSTAAGLERGSEHGPIVSRSDPAASRLLRVLGYEDRLTDVHGKVATKILG